MHQIEQTTSALFSKKFRLDGFEIDADSEIIIGGDFNVILDYDRDGFGGKPKLIISCKKLKIAVHHLT